MYTVNETLNGLHNLQEGIKADILSGRRGALTALRPGNTRYQLYKTDWVPDSVFTFENTAVSFYVSSGLYSGV